MCKFLKLTLMVLLFSSVNLAAQTIHPNTVNDIAYRDAANFKLNNKEKINLEYFSPSEHDVSDPLLLNNPEYIKAFKNFAFKKERKKRTFLHYVLIGATTFGTAVAITTLGASAGR